jgi:hypothetical protein
MKSGVGTAENAAPALFLYPKNLKSLVYFCSFYAAAKSEEKVRTERFEPIKLKQIYKSQNFALLLIKT